MKIITLDFESFYSSAQGYTLRKMTPVEYVLDPRFEAIGCAVKEGLHAPSYWVDGPDLQRFFDSLDPEVTCMGSHNWLFDGCIVAWRFGFVPKLMFCTMSMAKATLRHELRSVSLKSVLAHLGLPAKGDTVHKVDGMNRAAIIAAGIYPEYIDYSINDNEGCSGIFKKLVVEPGSPFPKSELVVMDAVLRCAIQPRFRLNKQLLAEHYADVIQQKNVLLAQAMLIGAGGKSDLMSNEKFAAMLRSHGVEPPTKISATTGKETYAFAKTDVDFLELAEHHNPAVQVLVAARLGHKSTLEETRTQRFINISNLTWPSNVSKSNQPCALMPMPIAYAAAHTHRLGGDWSLNVQNLKRGGKLRDALEAPPGHKVMTADEAQVEAREVVTFCGQWDVVEQFARGEDTYAALATNIFGFPVNKKTHPIERFVGKQGRLGLGYQLWWPNFQARLKTDSKNQLGQMIELTDDEACNVVTTFRRLNDKVEESWGLLNTHGIAALAGGGNKFTFASCEFVKGEIIGPNGLKLHYHDLRKEFDRKKGKDQWMFTYQGKRHGIYGGKLLENICQFLARIITLEAAVRIQRRTRQEFGKTFYLAQQAHDENVFIVPDDYVEDMGPIMLDEMRRRPWWAPELPLDAELGVGTSYGDAK
jgi:DNA polymerase